MLNLKRLNRIESTGKKVEVLIERREISSTLGLKSASWEPSEASERRRSQGESRWDWSLQKLFFDENAIPNVKPSDLLILVSAQGRFTPFVSAASETTATTIRIGQIAIAFRRLLSASQFLAMRCRQSWSLVRQTDCHRILNLKIYRYKNSYYLFSQSPAAYK